MPADKTRQMRLGAFFHPTGHHTASWRHEDAPHDAAFDLGHYIAMAKTAERGCFDLLFLADGSVVRDKPQWANQYVAIFEPLTLLSALSQHTSHIGLVATASTTYYDPFRVARAFASLDLLSNGRAGWNLVTSGDPKEGRNFSRAEHMAHDNRYERAGEFADVVQGLWDSWEADAFIQDRERGLYCDVVRMHALDHKGKFFDVAGPLNVARSSQGQPVIVQAGSSEAGRDLAARTAEVVFTSQNNIEAAKTFYADLKGRMAAYGRRPNQLSIMPGVAPVIGRTRAEAEDKRAHMDALTPIESAMALLSEMLGHVDLSGFPPDGPVPELPPSEGSHHFRQSVIDFGRKGLTLREVAQKTAGSRSHRDILGTGVEIADQLQEWLEANACDGFNVMPPLLPGDLEDFVEHVVPELQRRGLLRTSYEGHTLRGNLGLDVPQNRYMLQRRAS